MEENLSPTFSGAAGNVSAGSGFASWPIWHLAEKVFGVQSERHHETWR
jgi:hypothetical protein